MTTSPNLQEISERRLLPRTQCVGDLNLSLEYEFFRTNIPGDYHLGCPGRWGGPAAQRAGTGSTMCTYQLGLEKHV